MNDIEIRICETVGSKWMAAITEPEIHAVGRSPFEALGKLLRKMVSLGEWLENIDLLPTQIKYLNELKIFVDKFTDNKDDKFTTTYSHE